MDHPAFRTALHLNPGLLANPFVALYGTPIRLPWQGQRNNSEVGGCGDVMSLKFAYLQFGYARDERKIVVRPPLGVTMTSPAADFTMRIGFGIAVLSNVGRYSPLKTSSDTTVIRGVIGNAECLRLGV